MEDKLHKLWLDYLRICEEKGFTPTPEQEWKESNRHSLKGVKVAKTNKDDLLEEPLEDIEQDEPLVISESKPTGSRVDLYIAKVNEIPEHKLMEVAKYLNVTVQYFRDNAISIFGTNSSIRNAIIKAYHSCDNIFCAKNINERIQLRLSNQHLKADKVVEHKPEQREVEVREDSKPLPKEDVKREVKADIVDEYYSIQEAIDKLQIQRATLLLYIRREDIKGSVKDDKVLKADIDKRYNDLVAKGKLGKLGRKKFTKQSSDSVPTKKTKEQIEEPKKVEVREEPTVQRTILDSETVELVYKSVPFSVALKVLGVTMFTLVAQIEKGIIRADYDLGLVSYQDILSKAKYNLTRKNCKVNPDFQKMLDGASISHLEDKKYIVKDVHTVVEEVHTEKVVYKDKVVVDKKFTKAYKKLSKRKQRYFYHKIMAEVLK